MPLIARTDRSTPERQPHLERAAPSRPLARGGDGAAVHLDEPTHQGQTEAQPALGPVEPRVHLDEGLEHLFHHPGRNPSPGVPDAKHGLLGRHGDRDLDRPTLLGELGRIRQQIGDHLLQAGRVGVERHHLASTLHDEPDAPGVEQRLDGSDGGIEHDVQVDAAPAELEGPAGDARHVEQVIDQPHQVAELPVDGGLVVRGSAGVGPRALEQLQGHGERCQRVPQLVRQHREEFVLALVGDLELRFPELQRLHRRPGCVLAAAGAEGGLDRGDQGGHPDRALDDRHVAEQAGQLLEAGGRGLPLHGRREHHQRQVGPGRLPVEAGGEVSPPRRGRRPPRRSAPRRHPPRSAATRAAA